MQGGGGGLEGRAPGEQSRRLAEQSINHSTAKRAALPGTLRSSPAASRPDGGVAV